MMAWPTQWIKMPYGEGAIVSVFLIVLFLAFVLYRMKGWNRLMRHYKTQKRFIFNLRPYVFQFSLTALIFLGIAWTLLWRPVVEKKNISQKVKGLNVFFLVDVSRSMDIEDYGVTRLEAVKRQIEVYVKKAVRENHAFGLAVFTNSFYFMCPLTNDADTFLYLLDQVNPGMLQNQGTRLSDVLTDMIEVTQKVLKKSQLRSETKNPLFTIFSDGEDFSKKPFKLPTESDLRGRFVFVGVGKEKPMPVPIIENGRKTFLMDQKGNPIMSQAQFGSLKSLSHETSGEFFTLEEAPLVQLLKRSEATQGRSVQLTTYQPAYGVLGLILLILFLLKVFFRFNATIWSVFLISFCAQNSAYALKPWSYFQNKSGQTAYEQKKFQEAKQHVSGNLNDRDASSRDSYNLGLLSAQEGRFEEAESYFQKGIDSEDQELMSHRSFGQGLLAMKTGNFEGAVEYFKRSLNSTMESDKKSDWVNPFEDRARWHLVEALKAREQKKQREKKQREKQKQEKGKKQQDSQSKSSSEKRSGQEGQKKQQKGQGEKQEMTKPAQSGQAGKEQKKKVDSYQPTQAEIEQAEALKKELMDQRIKQDFGKPKGQMNPVFKSKRRGKERGYQGPAY